jgi:hypothetical protein
MRLKAIIKKAIKICQNKNKFINFLPENFRNNAAILEMGVNYG